MGLITGLLTLPLAPVRGVAWIADRLEETAERETSDPAVLRAQLAALNRALDEGEIDQERFEREEDRLLDLLEGRPPGTGPAHPVPPPPGSH
ncbi:gas vesicle protein GvpG [Streptomyces sp. NPDC058374]|uniref:gas vesicle protein GvpG n=1 Tax=unclassified Streptomyces TaxID=2593676 RepID=UPI00365733CF